MVERSQFLYYTEYGHENDYLYYAYIVSIMKRKVYIDDFENRNLNKQKCVVFVRRNYPNVEWF